MRGAAISRIFDGLHCLSVLGCEVFRNQRDRLLECAQTFFAANLSQGFDTGNMQNCDTFRARDL